MSDVIARGEFAHCVLRSAAFCTEKSTFSFADIDRGKVICISIPQRFKVERRYIHTLMKLVFYSHVLMRFDKPAETRAKDNLLILWADEAQKIVTANEDGTSDYNVVDVIREAKANGLSKDELIRKLMLGKMQRSEYTNQRNQEIVAWVEEHPEIKAKVEQRIRNVPPENRERAFIPKGREPSIRTLREWTKLRRIPYHRVGHFVYFDPAEVALHIQTKLKVPARG